MKLRTLDCRHAAPLATFESVRFDGHTYPCRPGESLAVCLWANGVRVLGRSPKYHRPRGPFCLSGSCGNCQVRIDGLPNEAACMHPAHTGCEASSQHGWPSVAHDVMGLTDVVFAQGFDHHHFMTGSHLLNAAAVRATRKLAGAGRLPDQDAVLLPVERVACQVAIVGAGRSGVACAQALREAKVSVFQCDQHQGTTAVGYYDERELIVVGATKLVRVISDAVVLATGAYALFPPVMGNDLPGVLSVSAARTLVDAQVLPGRSVLLGAPASENEDLLTTLRDCGARVSVAEGPLVAVREQGGKVAGARTVDCEYSCDAVVCEGPIQPALELARQMGVEALFDRELGVFMPSCTAHGQTNIANVFICGEAAGVSRKDARAHGMEVAREAQKRLPT